MGAKTKRIVITILKVLGLLLLNLLMIVAGEIVYFGFTDDLLNITKDSEMVDWVFGPLLIVGTLLYIVIPGKNLKRYGFGGFVLGLSCLSYAIFYLNAAFTREGSYRMHRVCEHYLPDESGMKIAIDRSRSAYCLKIEVAPENNLQVDSVLVREDKGLFGMAVYTNHIQIPESQNCAHGDFMVSHPAAGHFKMGGELRYNRCFSGAIREYSKAIELDSSFYDGYYQRGFTRMLMGNYEEALNDLKESLTAYADLDTSILKDLYGEEGEARLKELSEGVVNKDYSRLSELMEILKQRGSINDLLWRVKLIGICMERLKGNKTYLSHR